MPAASSRSNVLDLLVRVPVCRGRAIVAKVLAVLFCDAVFDVGAEHDLPGGQVAAANAAQTPGRALPVAVCLYPAAIAWHSETSTARRGDRPAAGP